MAEPRFKDKIALVTGSGRGIGKAIALRLASEGADIAVNYFRNREFAETTAVEIRALGRRAIVIKADVGNEGDIHRLVETVDSKLGGLDVLVNNAASGYNRSVMEQRVKAWDWTMNINARSAGLRSGRRIEGCVGIGDSLSGCRTCTDEHRRQCGVGGDRGDGCPATF